MASISSSFQYFFRFSPLRSSTFKRLHDQRSKKQTPHALTSWSKCSKRTCLNPSKHARISVGEYEEGSALNFLTIASSFSSPEYSEYVNHQTYSREILPSWIPSWAFKWTPSLWSMAKAGILFARIGKTFVYQWFAVNGFTRTPSSCRTYYLLYCMMHG